jgi:hypothetical protein
MSRHGLLQFHQDANGVRPFPPLPPPTSVHCALLWLGRRGSSFYCQLIMEAASLQQHKHSVVGQSPPRQIAIATRTSIRRIKCQGFELITTRATAGVLSQESCCLLTGPPSVPGRLLWRCCGAWYCRAQKSRSFAAAEERKAKRQSCPRTGAKCTSTATGLEPVRENPCDHFPSLPACAIR